MLRGASVDSLVSGTSTPVLPPSRESSLPPSATTVTPTSDIRLHRTWTSDQVVAPKRNHPVRDKCLEMIYNALATDSQHPSEHILAIADDLELAIYTMYSAPSDPYRNRVRHLVTRLKSNQHPPLRHALVEKTLLVSAFVSMSDQDLKSQQAKEREALARERNLWEAQGASQPQASTDMFKCGKCKQRKTTYYQMQTRSADEPMTTFVTCVHCGNRWKVLLFLLSFLVLIFMVVLLNWIRLEKNKFIVCTKHEMYFVCVCLL